MRLSDQQLAALEAMLTESSRTAVSWDVATIMTVVKKFLERVPRTGVEVVLDPRATVCTHGFITGVCGYCLAASGQIPEVKLPDRGRFQP